MNRTPLITLGLTITALILLGVLFVFGSRRVESLSRQVSDVARRLTSVESVYDTSECTLTATEDGACDVGEGRSMLLGTMDADGEVRALVLRAKDGTETHVGRLGRDATYVRTKQEDGSPEGFLSDSKEGTVEIYAADPKLNPLDRDERLPVMVRHIFAVTTSTTP